MAGIFKAYDIRGIYGEKLTDALAEKIGRAFATFVKPKKVVVGYDMRPHSKPLFEALARGLTTQGADVICIGMCSTPMSNFANGTLKADASIMITASHNTQEWNGFKMAIADAVPISGDTGIADIERIVESGSFDAPAEKPGSVTEHSVIEEYRAKVREFADLEKPIRIVADMANAMGIMESSALEGIIEFDPLFNTYDGSFPNHEANPLKAETMEALQKKVRAGSYDFGISFDGDADRAGFVDENGTVVPMDIIGALMAGELLAHEKAPVLYDLRSSWAVKEYIEENGGTPVMSRVGHAFIKKQMRDHNAIFAGELSGHYYFRDNFFTESTGMAVIAVANIVSKSGKTLSELVKPIQRYFASGEINSEVEDTGKTLELIKDRYGKDGKIIELDGVTVEFEDWWFNVRPSNTEPLIRLNLEARTREMMETKRDEVLSVIRDS